MNSSTFKRKIESYVEGGHLFVLRTAGGGWYLEALVIMPTGARARREKHRLAQEPPVPPTELAEQTEGDGAIVERRRAKVIAEGRHHIHQHLCTRIHAGEHRAGGH